MEVEQVEPLPFEHVVDLCQVARRERERADGRVKVAIVMHKLGVSREEAEAAIERGGGVIRRVVPGEPPPV